MIYLLHGDNTNASYQRLSRLFIENRHHQKVRADNITPDELTNQMMSTDLLGAKKIIVAENIIGKYKLQPQQLARLKSDNVLVLWEKKELTRSQSTAFAKEI